jgi:hypothetical protein
MVAATAIASAAALSSPTVLAHLQRTLAGLHGQWWRTGVTLASGVVLACVRNIHGAALLAGGVLAALLGGVARGAESPRSGTPSPSRSD